MLGTIITLEGADPSFPPSMCARSVRYYPNGTTASHILGYLGKISESERVYLEKGYSASDMVGKDGVEKAEEVLRN